MRTNLMRSIILGMVLFLFVGCGAAPPPNDSLRPVSAPTGAPTALPGSMTIAPRVQPPTPTTAAVPTACIQEQYDEKKPDGSVKHVQLLCDGTFRTQVIATAQPVPATALADQIEAAWGAGDWPQVIVLLKRGTPIDVCKLYAAYFNYGQTLLTKGDKAGAAIQFQSADGQTGCGGEAGQAILALTPSPTPTRTSVPLPPAATATSATAAVATATTPGNSGIRIGAVCNDGTSSSATGSGACSHHKGVAYWLYR